MFIDFREEKKGGGGERERETERQTKRDNVREEHRLVASCILPDQGSNPQPFDVWDDDAAKSLWLPWLSYCVEGIKSFDVNNLYLFYSEKQMDVESKFNELQGLLFNT